MDNDMNINNHRKIIGFVFQLTEILIGFGGISIYYIQSKPIYFTLSMGAICLLFSVESLLLEETKVKGTLIRKSEDKKSIKVSDLHS